MRWLLAICALLLPIPAAAEWHEAQTENFVIYADNSASNIRAFAEQLERFHAAMELVTQRDLPVPSPSNRVTVFVVANLNEVRQLYGKNGAGVGGFYIPRAAGSTAFVPDRRVGEIDGEDFLSILLHEYAHHFLMFNSAFPLPRWMNEGGAEFFAATKFEDDGSLVLGLPNRQRFWELSNFPINSSALTDPAALAVGNNYRGFYGRSWALYHYLSFAENRSGQMAQYLTSMANGADSPTAARVAFGDLDALDREVTRYIRRPRLESFTIAAGLLQTGQITVRELRPGEAAAMDVRMRSRRGVDEEQAQAVLADARPLAARHGDDPAVWAALAEAEYDAGNRAEAIAAADRALALDPGMAEAYVQKGYALFALADELEDPDARTAAYRAAAAPFVALNRLEEDHPLSLFYYHKSQAARGNVSDLARDGLARAVLLAPFDRELRMALVNQRLNDGDLAQAARDLRPFAFSAHGGWFADKAAEVIERIRAGATEDDRRELIELLYSDPPAEDGAAPASGDEESDED